MVPTSFVDRTVALHSLRSESFSYHFLVMEGHLELAPSFHLDLDPSGSFPVPNIGTMLTPYNRRKAVWHRNNHIIIPAFLLCNKGVNLFARHRNGRVPQKRGGRDRRNPARRPKILIGLKPHPDDGDASCCEPFVKIGAAANRFSKVKGAYNTLLRYQSASLVPSITRSG